MEVREFLEVVHKDLPPGYAVELLQVPGTSRLIDPTNFAVPQDLATTVWHHGVYPRRLKDGEIAVARLVFADTDGSIDDYEEIVPKPTAVIHSGRANGYHLYWRLSRWVDPVEASRLALLAAVAFEGDYQVCHRRITTRVPGSANTKYAPYRIVALKELNGDLEYDPDELAEMLIAATFQQYYVAGERHAMSLALAALLVRAAWPIDRAIRCVNFLYDLNPGNDREDKISCVRSTYLRVERGEAVSSAAIKAVLEKERFLRLLEGLGISARDGDLVVQGEVVGKLSNIERDVTHYILETNEIRSADGRVVEWNNLFWRQIEEAELSSRTFAILSGAKYSRQGDLVEVQATAKLAKAISSMVIGTTIGRPLPEPHPYHLPLLNGTLDLRTLTLEPTTRDHNHRWVVNVNYDADAVSPTWQAYMEECVPDPEIRALLQQWLGYMLMAGNRWQRMLWLYGKSGTGKSTYLKAVAILLGPAATAITADKFSDYTVAQLSGSRAGLCAELSPNLLRTSTVKSMVSGDPVQARHPS